MERLTGSAAKTWRESLRPGDPVALTDYIGGRPKLTSVKHVTATQIALMNARFRTSDGLEIGGDRWRHRDMQPVTPAILAEIAYRDALERIAKVNWNKLPREAVMAVDALVIKAVQEPR